MKFSFAKFHKRSIDESIVKLIQQIASEKNSVIDKFNQLKQVSNSALQSQALIQLKTEYCVKNNCLQCAIGSALLSKID